MAFSYNPFHHRICNFCLFYVACVQFTVLTGQSSVFFTGIDDLHYYNANGQVQMVEDTSYAIIHFGSAVSPSDLVDLLDSFPDSDLLETGDGVTISNGESLEDIFIDNEQFINEYNLSTLEVQSIAPGYSIQGSPSFVNDQVVVKVGDGITLNDLSPKISRFGGIVEDSITNEILLIKLDSIKGQLELIQELYTLGLIDWGQPNFHVEVCTSDIDPMFKNQFQLNNIGQSVGRNQIIPNLDINALEAWNITKGDPSITVAIMDDGLEPHEDLSGVLQGYNPTTEGNGHPDTYDSYHGQACGGLIAADHNNIGIRGIAPDVTTTGINISSCGVTVSDIARGFLWARDNDIDILSCSWGFQQRDSTGRISGPVCNQDLHPVITAAIKETALNGRSGKGCLIVFSSGNSYSPFPDNYCVTYPANMDEVMSVGAVNPSNEQRSAYSCYGVTLDVCAPSSGLLDFWVVTLDRMGDLGASLTNYKNDFGGTSAAAPLVSGVAALMLSLDPTLTRVEMTDIIQQSSSDLGADGVDPEFGFGLVNAYQALLATLPGTAEFLSEYACMGEMLLDQNFEEFASQNDPRAQQITSSTLSDGSNLSTWFNIIPDGEYLSEGFDAGAVTNLKLSFDFIGYGTAYSDSFELQLSVDNGASFHTVNTFDYSNDFINGNNYDYTTSLEGSFGPSTILRIVANVSSSEASLFVDNVNVGSCTD